MAPVKERYATSYPHTTHVGGCRVTLNSLQWEHERGGKHKKHKHSSKKSKSSKSKKEKKDQKDKKDKSKQGSELSVLVSSEGPESFSTKDFGMSHFHSYPWTLCVVTPFVAVASTETLITKSKDSSVTDVYSIYADI